MIPQVMNLTNHVTADQIIFVVMGVLKTPVLIILNFYFLVHQNIL